MDEHSDLSSELQDRLEAYRQSDSTSTLQVSTDEAYIGDTITIDGTDLPANESLDVVWHSAEGFWGVLEGNEIIGPQYRSRRDRIATISTDSDGGFSETWEIPEDYGGEHVLKVQTDGEETVAEATIVITPWFEINRESAPLGETFRITAHGLGPNYITSNYQLTWDNTMVGFVTGTMNRGKATAKIRAVGPVGDHVVQVWRNFHGTPFLQNNTQSPFGPVAGGRQSAWTVEVTEPESDGPVATMDELVDEQPLAAHLIDPDVETDAELHITPTSGQAGTIATIEGTGFPAETRVDLVWHTHEGHHIQGTGLSPEPVSDALPTVTTYDDGTFSTDVTIPSDVGSTRPITADVDGHTVASTGFMMQPDIVQMSPTSGPIGTDIAFEFRGIGWTMADTAYFFVYDNQRVGYICGSDNDDGVARTILKAAGEPGHHFIDVYPGIFKTKEDKPDFTLKPHLSYLDNHPVRPLPAFHFRFEVTE